MYIGEIVFLIITSILSLKWDDFEGWEFGGLFFAIYILFVKLCPMKIFCFENVLN